MRDKVDFFYLGPPKSGSSWLFRCLSEHPDINASSRDELYYFDRFYAYGQAWYDGHYDCAHSGLRIDCTPSYIYNPRALRLIYQYNPRARLSFGLRHPVERAFSAYWHIKKKGHVTWRFDEILTDFYAHLCCMEGSWLSEGAGLIKSLFPEGHLHVFRFEDIKNNPEALMRDVYCFAGVDENFVPPSLRRKVNVAGPRQTRLGKLGNKVAGFVFGRDHGAQVGVIEAWLTGKGELRKGVDPQLYEKLLVLCTPEIDRLEDVLDLDLSAWRRVPEMSAVKK